jgi:hypothetical protein
MAKNTANLIRRDYNYSSHKITIGSPVFYRNKAILPKPSSKKA